MIKVGDTVKVIDIEEGFYLHGVEVGKEGKVVELLHNYSLVRVSFDGIHNYIAYTDWKRYLESVRNGNTAILLVEKVEDGVEENIPWFKTSRGIEWLYNNFPETPKELQTYRHGQVFKVSGHDTPYMLVSCVEEGSHTLVNLRTGLQFSLLPYTEEVTYSDVYEMFGGLIFSLVADSAEEYFKEKLND